MSVIFRAIERQDYEQVRQLLIDTGWQERVANRDRFERMIGGASRTVVAVDEGRSLVSRGPFSTGRRTATSRR